MAKIIREAPVTVSREIDKFEQRVEEVKLQKAAEEYQVSELVEELHSIAVLKTRDRLTNEDLASGCRIAAIFKKNNIDLTEAEGFAREVFNRSRAKNYPVDEIIVQCSELNKLEESYGPFDELKVEWNDIGKNIGSRREESESLKVEVRDLKKKGDDAQRELSEVLEQNSVTKKDIEDYRAKKKNLLNLPTWLKSFVFHVSQMSVAFFSLM